MISPLTFQPPPKQFTTNPELATPECPYESIHPYLPYKNTTRLEGQISICQQFRKNEYASHTATEPSKVHSGAIPYLTACIDYIQRPQNTPQLSSEDRQQVIQRLSHVRTLLHNQPYDSTIASLLHIKPFTDQGSGLPVAQFHSLLQQLESEDYYTRLNFDRQENEHYQWWCERQREQESQSLEPGEITPMDPQTTNHRNVDVDDESQDRDPEISELLTQQQLIAGGNFASCPEKADPLTKLTSQDLSRILAASTTPFTTLLANPISNPLTSSVASSTTTTNSSSSSSFTTTSTSTQAKLQ